MPFNSLEFAAFFGCVLVAFYAWPSWAWRKAVIVVSSYIYYGAWYPPYVLLLLATTAIDFAIALMIERASTPVVRKAWVATSVSMNLAVLAFFKYVGFLAATLNSLLTSAGLPALSQTASSTAAEIVVPIGLSFYTFQSIAYVVDVYRREGPAVRSWPDYMAFVSFFPLLAAGPIMRARELVTQIELPRLVPSAAKIGAGLFLIVLGLFQKVVLADNIAPLVNLVFKTPAAFSALDLWVAVYGFAFQIYMDFAGYSNMAMGVAALLGFTIPRNFNMPYVAIGFSDFWRRWHISLSQWLRDYLYIPLGGNRSGSARTLINLGATMLLGGLWHGANWTFIWWGGLHGLYLAGERGVRYIGERLGLSRVADQGLPRFLLIALTFNLVCLAWVFFRAEGGMRQSFAILARMVSLDRATLSPSLAGQMPIVVVLMGVTLAAAAAHAWRLSVPGGPRLKAALAGLMLAAIALVPGDRNAFIYFQF